MSSIEDRSAEADVAAFLDQLSTAEAGQSNCMFQLALMLARIAVEPAPDSYKDEAAQALMALIRARPKGNVVRLFGDRPRAVAPTPALRDAG